MITAKETCAVLGKIFSVVSDDSVLKTCIPPTCNTGSILIAMTIIPTPPIHWRSPRQSRMPSGIDLMSLRIVDPGSGMTGVVTVVISNPPFISTTGNYNYNEIVTGNRSATQGRVKDWDFDTKILKVSNVGIGTTAKGFVPGEILTGAASSTVYSVQSFTTDDIYDEYASNEEIEAEADLILDFTQSNPFGSY